MADTKERRRLPVFQGLLPFDRKRIPMDVAAGVTLAALGIPEVMGYTAIAGVPVITGLYTILIPIAVFAMLGSSRHLVVGADSATAAIMAAGLAGMAPIASPEYVALAGMLAIMTGGMLILARIVRLGFIADFLSRSVLIGFLTGVGIQVAMGQVGGMLGIPDQSGGTVRKFVKTLGHISDTHTATMVVSLVVLVVIVGGRMINPRIPGALIAVVGMIFVSWNWDLAGDGVATLGKVPSGLPNFGVPDVTWTQFESMLGTAAACFVVILAQSAATSRAYAAKYGETFDENVDLVGLGLANASAGLSGTFVVNGSPTKTQMVDGAGGRSQLAQLTTAVIVLLVLLFFTKPLQYMPEAVLSSVVFLIGLELIDVKGMLGVFRLRPDEFVIATVTALTVVIVGVEQAIVLAVILSIVDHLRRSYHPYDTVLETTNLGRLKEIPYEVGVQVRPGLVVYRFGSSIYYANAAKLTEEIRGLVEAPGKAPEWLCLDATAVSDVDYSGQQTVKEILGSLQPLGVRLVVAGVTDDVRSVLDRYGLTTEIGADALFESVHDVLDAFGSGTHSGTDPSDTRHDP